MLPGTPTGSPQAAMVVATYPSGTTTVSAVLVGMLLKPSSGPLPAVLAQPANSGASAPPASAAIPPLTQTRRAGSETL